MAVTSHSNKSPRVSGVFLRKSLSTNQIRLNSCNLLRRLRFSHEAICRCNVPRNFSLDLESRSDLSSMICWWFVICWGDMSPSVSRHVWCSLLPPTNTLTCEWFLKLTVSLFFLCSLVFILRGRDRGLPLKYDAGQGLFTQRWQLAPTELGTVS